jgi:glycosyltransferase involved in cell wall biosynthesis
MKIVMLEKNYLIDRRILQACDSLSADGHELHICAVTRPARVPTADRISHPLSAFHPVNLGSNQHKYDLWSRVAEGGGKRLDMIRAFIMDPSLGARAIPASRFPSFVKKPAAALMRLATDVRNRTRLREYSSYLSGLPEGIALPDDWDFFVAEHVCKVLRPDILQANDLPTLKAAAMISATLGCPIVYDAHELYSYQPGIPSDVAKRMFEEERILSQLAVATLVINSDQAEVMAKDFGLKRLVPCTNAIDPPPDFDPASRPRLIQSAIGLKAHERVMLFQGAVNIARRIDLLVKGLALAKSKHVHLAFLTFSDPEFFRKMAKDLGIGHRVHFLPPVAWDDMINWCASADCGVMPYQATDLNTKISSPNKMYEFIQACTPMIGSSELVNVERIVGRNGFGVLAPLREASDYANVIDEMFDESKGGAERFRPAILAKRRDYTWERAFQPVRELYRELAGRAGPVYQPGVARATNA